VAQAHQNGKTALRRRSVRGYNEMVTTLTNR
jgi:hypothetical protein